MVAGCRASFPACPKRLAIALFGPESAQKNPATSSFAPDKGREPEGGLVDSCNGAVNPREFQPGRGYVSRFRPQFRPGHGGRGGAAQRAQRLAPWTPVAVDCDRCDRLPGRRMA